MRIVITGATGFVGRPLVERLSGEGHEVVVLTRSPDRARARMPAVADAFGWEPMEGPPPAESLEGADAVVHLAGESVAGRWTDEKRRAIRESRVIGTRHLVDAIAERGGPARLLSASAVGYYGDRGDEILDEGSPPGEGFLADVCREWEAEAGRAREHGVNVTTPRLGIVMGRGGGALDELLGIYRKGLGGPLGSGAQWWPWIHLADVVGLVAWLLERGIDGPVNVVAPEPARQRDFSRSLARALRRPAVLPAPAFGVRMMLGGFADELLWSRRAVPARATREGWTFGSGELDAALDDLVGRSRRRDRDRGERRSS